MKMESPGARKEKTGYGYKDMFCCWYAALFLFNLVIETELFKVQDFFPHMFIVYIAEMS